MRFALRWFYAGAPLYTREPPSPRDCVRRTIVQIRRPSLQPALTCAESLTDVDAARQPIRPGRGDPIQRGAVRWCPAHRACTGGRESHLRIAVGASAAGDGAHADVDCPGGRSGARAHPASRAHRQQPEPDRPLGQYLQSECRGRPDHAATRLPRPVLVGRISCTGPGSPRTSHSVAWIPVQICIHEVVHTPSDNPLIRCITTI